MNEIKLTAENGEYLCLYMDEEFFTYGKSEIEIKVSNYYVRGLVWFSFGELTTFCNELNRMYERMQGKVELVDSEGNLAITILFNRSGYFVLKGRYQADLSKENELLFELEITQPSMERWNKELNAYNKS